MQKALAAGLETVYKHTPRGLSKYHDVMVARGEGSYVFTTTGQKFLDLTSGIGVTSTGHCHPAVVKAVQDQAGLMVHAQQNIFGGHLPLLALTERLASIMPASLDQFFLANSGAEAVDNAIKIARSATGKPNIIVFDGSFHGRTIGAMALTTSKTIYREGFGPFMGGVHVSPYPYCLHCKVQQVKGRSGYPVEPDVEPFCSPSKRDCCGQPLESLQWLLQLQTAPRDTAAIIIEPILGEGGFITPPPGFLPAIRKICTDNNILMIVDEIQSGAGRTGRWWGHQHFMGPDAAGGGSGAACEPDMLIFAKGIASGYPLAGVACRDEHFNNMKPGAMGGTYGSNAVACAAAAATIDTIVKENILQNATDRGHQLMKGLLALVKEFPEMIDIRGRGLMVGLEFGNAQGGYGASPGLAGRITKACAKRNLLLLTAGARESIRFLPALVITADQIDTTLTILEEAMREVMRGGAAKA